MNSKKELARCGFRYKKRRRGTRQTGGGHSAVEGGDRVSKLEELRSRGGRSEQRVPLSVGEEREGVGVDKKNRKRKGPHSGSSEPRNQNFERELTTTAISSDLRKWGGTRQRGKRVFPSVEAGLPTC